MSLPSLHSEVEGLYALVNRRVALLPKLLGLSGRLELMLSQIAEPGDVVVMMVVIVVVGGLGRFERQSFEWGGAGIG